LEIEDLKKEINKIEKEIKNRERILNSEKEMNNLIIKELEDFKTKQYKAGEEIIDFKRKTEISEKEIKKINKINTIQIENYFIGITKDGLLYKNKNKPENIDFEYEFNTNTKKSICIFSDNGNVYKQNVYKIQNTEKDLLKNINHIFNFEGNLINIIDVNPEEEEKEFAFFITKNGTVKKTDIKELVLSKFSSLLAIKIEEGDTLIKVYNVRKDHIVLLNSIGKYICFSSEEVREMGRNAIGVVGMKLKENTFIIDANTINENETIVFKTENFFTEKYNFNTIKKQNRGGMGLMPMVITKKSGEIKKIEKEINAN